VADINSNTFNSGVPMSPIVVTYLTYLLLSLGLTVWVARTLSSHGHVFLIDVFAGAEQLATSVNRLLVVGFYLVNLGYVSLALRIGGDVPDARAAIESLSTKIGGVLLVLGVLHLGNVFVLSRMRRRRQLERQPRPALPPTVWMPPTGPAPVGPQA
jgi:hypothetical protein